MDPGFKHNVLRGFEAYDLNSGHRNKENPKPDQAIWIEFKVVTAVKGLLKGDPGNDQIRSNYLD